MRARGMFTAGMMLAVLAGGTAWAQSGVVTIYSADGLHDGSPNWYQTEFDAFTKATGIRVRYVEAGSAVVVDRVEREKANPQADVLVTLPPFIQKAASDGLLQPYTPTSATEIAARDKDPNGLYYAMIDNYANWIYNASVLKSPPATFQDLLAPQFKNKIQYSTPGEAGDGTAVMLNVFQAFGGPTSGLAYLKQLQANNLGPSSSTGRLTALVNKGEIWVANGDMQMNLAQMRDNPNIRIFWLAGPDGKRMTFSLPYDIALVKGAPDAENGRKLIDFLLSKEAQEQVAPIAMGIPVRTDVSPAGETYATMQALLKGVEIWSPDWASLLTNLEVYVSQWHQATGS
ncbi:MAG TPA: 2-aminoethylphosphonate ABC transporter substrate-binding protein [Acetobacteraceae bacterium]|nr:2-aminoethylphosphonate ABC transporter substrate-binding protein [Acetobacteraceae bacterium]